MMRTEVRLFNKDNKSMLTFCDDGDGTMSVIVTNNSQSAAASFPLKDIFDFISKVYDIELLKDQEENEDEQSSSGQ
jgi:hypothetical protein